MTRPAPLATLDWLSNRLLEISGLLLLVMMLHVTLDVALKYLLNQPVPGTLEVVSYYYMVGTVFLPIAFIELTRGSVAVDLFYGMMGRRAQIACMAFVLAMCVAIYSGLAWITYGDAIKSFTRGEVVMGPVTVVVWPSRFVLPISFALGALVCLYHLFRMLTDQSARNALTDLHEEGGDI
ncbi:TRAP transporter small permease subunit [Arenibacterium halophilum]|jgi:TRAP-type C4-dicarboxylate transport system permease small subunit|uniref:TRAP transporter small permease protein n=1 Tax=Arenibacterium halophilum TaxID=2583821 RepID=A0ABY2XDA8_9RHOB|nr:TRAP transporter small permease [Arenibacterium halophilum]MAY86879.1 hypothetical protein [Pseudooceanicola sp.]TMV15006.1 TRAP transporter small permease [Arenibacterium halophilum]|tara:strand:+ start:173 stop:712 length:540 start_codon:yes stop_codon:yes gene_type:complete